MALSQSIPTGPFRWTRNVMSTPRDASSGGKGEEEVDSNASYILGITGTLFAVSTAVVLLRCYVRAVMLKSFGIDDFIMLLAMGMALGSMICFAEMVAHGAGRWYQDIPIEWMMGYGNLTYWSYIMGPMLTTGISLVKISCGCFLRRFVQIRWQQILLDLTIGFCAMFLVYSILTYMLNCIPLHAIWDGTIQEAKCLSQEAVMNIGTINGIINTTTDLIFVILPIPVVLKLQVHARTKAVLIAILSLGLFACAACVVRMVYAYRMFAPDYSRHCAFLVWFDIELHAGILAASLPSLRPLFGRAFRNRTTAGTPKYDACGFKASSDRTGTTRSATTGRNTIYSRYGPKSPLSPYSPYGPRSPLSPCSPRSTRFGHGYTRQDEDLITMDEPDMEYGIAIPMTPTFRSESSRAGADGISTHFGGGEYKVDVATSSLSVRSLSSSRESDGIDENFVMLRPPPPARGIMRKTEITIVEGEAI